ncbi:MAG: hypothetical protein Q4F71_10995, partial [Paracoccus sp. (in: a-proteobacteria)]|nr:hypothetical protein [Paracoccus sp. (in: a-proteobacteria)]
MAIRKILGAAVVLSAIAGGAHAQSAETQIRNQLQAQGFNQITIENNRRQIEVRANRGGQAIVLIYDARTGQLLSQGASSSNRSSNSSSNTSSNSSDNSSSNSS